MGSVSDSAAQKKRMRDYGLSYGIFKTGQYNAITDVSGVTVGQVTYAVRNTKLYGFDLSVGDIMGLDNKKILATGKSVSDVTIELIEKLRSDEEIITLYYGQDVSEEDANALKDRIQEKYPDCDVEIHYGGQPIYYYYIALE